MGPSTVKFITVGLLLALLPIGGCSDEKSVETRDVLRVVEVIPGAAKRQVRLDPSMLVTFNQQLDSLSIDSNTFVLNDSLRGIISISDRELTFTPALPLDSNTVYEARVSKDIADTAGRTLDADYTWSFKTVDGAGYLWKESVDSAANGMHDVIWQLGRFVMVGETGGYPIRGAIFSSVDGINWVARGGDNLSPLRAIDYFNGKFLIVGKEGTILSSTRGDQWVSVSSGTEAPLYDIASSSDACVAVSEGMVLRSNNGRDWREISVPYSERLISICWTGDKFIATTVGDSASYFLVSTDGVDWEKIVLEREGAYRMEFYSIGASDDLIVAVGPDRNLFTSVDGLTWDKGDLDLPPGGWVFLESVIWDGQRFVVVGGSHLSWGGFTAISPDGITWEQHNYVMGNGGEFTSIAWSGSRYVVSTNRMSGKIFYSP